MRTTHVIQSDSHQQVKSNEVLDHAKFIFTLDFEKVEGSLGEDVDKVKYRRAYLKDTRLQ
jgi:hypothetical protein